MLCTMPGVEEGLEILGTVDRESQSLGCPQIQCKASYSAGAGTRVRIWVLKDWDGGWG